VTTEERLAELYRCYGHLVLLRCQVILRDEAEAEDVMHTVFERAIIYGDSLARADSGLLWLYRVAERCCFDRLRQRRRHVLVAPDVLAGVAQGGLPQAVAEARDAIAAVLGGLDPGVQRVALLYFIDGLKQDEIARITGWSRRTVIKKIEVVRRQARSMLEAEAPAGTSTGGGR
jgi:RNA polymerase sigma-70 factor (ECF subfamily)